MGTRGLMAFTRNGELKGAYNHWDSYPSGLGDAIAYWLAEADLADAQAKFDALKVVDEDSKPTPEEQAALLGFANLDVSTRSTTEWYVLLRDAQGIPQGTLDSGYILDSLAFAKDSLFCEWAYVVDLDTGSLEVYKGFQQSPHTEGRFASEEADNGYYPVKLVRTFNLQELQESPKVVGFLEDELQD